MFERRGKKHYSPKNPVLPKTVLFISLFISLAFSTVIYGEGTASLAPGATNRANIIVNLSTYNNFARYDGNDDQRLYFHIKDPSAEQVFFGFSQPGDHPAYPCSGSAVSGYVRIKDPSGNVVWPTPGSPNGQLLNQLIANQAEAIAGPSQIVGASGYSGFTFDPSGLAAGDYYMELSSNIASNGGYMGIPWYDITVASKDPSPVAINGRVFSKNWAIASVSNNCSSPNPYGPFHNPFEGAFYAFSPSDSIVTRVDFNNSGFRPLWFNVFFNSTGTGNSGNVIMDRQSVEGALSGQSEYPLFLNNPDPSVWPSGSFGQIASPPQVVGCPSKDKCIIVEVTSSGQLEVLIDLDQTSGANLYDSGTRDVLVGLTVDPQPGEMPPYRRCLSWDGNDGFGDPVNLSNPVSYLVRYTQGIYHIPLYDGEYMTGGLSYTTIRPTAPPGSVQKFYYDDSDIPDNNMTGEPQVQNNGCNIPCHTWSNFDFGDENTINTWFYAAEEVIFDSGTPTCVLDAIDDSDSTPANTSVGVTVLNNDIGVAEIDTSIMTTSGVLQPLHGNVMVDPVTGIISYSPDLNYVGTDSFEYVICYDLLPADAMCDTAKVVMTITNDPPVANLDEETTDEDVDVSITASSNDTDADGNLDAASANTNCPVCTTPSNGSLINNNDGTFTYDPNQNYNGRDSFIYQICDVVGFCDTAYAKIVINPVNDPPVANLDEETTNEDVDVTITASSNDTDVDGNLDAASANTSCPVCTTPSNGSLINNNDGTFTYDPNQDYNGRDSFIYQICDTGGLCDTAYAKIVINPVNDPPVANLDEETTDEDVDVTITASSNDMDIEGNLDAASANTSCPVCTTPSNGSLINNNDGTFTYDPNQDYNGRDSFIYQICDTGGLCDTAYAKILINPVNDPPVANLDEETTDEDVDVTITASSNDTDVDGNLDAVSANTSCPVCTTPSNGSLINNNDGTFSYDPNSNFYGRDSFIYQICDAGGLCDTAYAKIVINPVNDPPVANLDEETTDEDVDVTITASSNDMDIEGNLNAASANTSCPVCTTPSNGSLINNNDGTFTYDPNQDYNGRDSFIYQICDTGGLCDTAYAKILINPVNDPPVADLDEETTNEDVDVNITASSNDTDVDGNLDAASANTSCPVCTTPSNGSLINNNDGTFTYDPNSNFYGRDSFIYQICDAGGLCDTAYAKIVINPVNDPPVAMDELTATPEDTPKLIDILNNDDDPNDLLGNIDSATVIVFIQPDDGIVSIDPVTGQVTYTPDQDFNGIDDFQYSVCDDGYPLPPLCDTAVVTIVVSSADDPPVANQDDEITDEDTPVTITVDSNDTDPDNDLNPSSANISCSVCSSPSDGMLINNGDGTFEYQPNPNFNGSDSFIYEICDDNNLCDTAVVNIIINTVIDPPIAVNDTISTNEDTPVITAVVSNDTDSDGNIDPTSVIIIDDADNGTTMINPVSGEIEYLPNPNYNGLDTITYVVCDLDNLCDTAMIFITVTPGNDFPVALNDMESTDEESPVTIDVLVNDNDDSDPLGNIDPASVGIVTPPTNGMTGVNPSTGEITYTPDPNFVGNDTLFYSVCDDGNPLPPLCDTARVIITVNPVNDPPVAIDDYAVTPEDTPIDIDVAFNDNDDLDPSGNIDPLSTQVVTNPTNGMVSVNPDGTLNYDPNLNFFGTDSLTYSICDDGNPLPVKCDTATVYITVNSQNDPPVAVDDVDSTFANIDTVVAVLINDYDIEDDDLEIVGSGTNSINNMTFAGGTATINDNGTPGDPTDDFIDYSPAFNFFGIDSFYYQISDGNGGLDTATVVIHVIIPPEDCSDGIDNDIDGFTDCDDSDCGITRVIEIAGDCSLLEVENPEPDWTFEWFKNGALILGETNSTYVPNLSDFGLFRVRVTNGNGCNVDSPEVEACCTPPKLSIGGK